MTTPTFSIASVIHFGALSILLWLTGCASEPAPEPKLSVSPLYQRYQDNGREAVGRGNWKQAQRAFQLAKAEADRRDQPRYAADAAYHLALVAYANGDFAAASEELSVARERSSLIADATPPEFDLLAAQIALAENQTEHAHTLLKVIEPKQLEIDQQCNYYLLMARIALSEDNIDSARQWLDRVRAASVDMPPLLQAEHTMLQAQLLEHDGRTALAAQAYEDAADVFAAQSAAAAQIQARIAAANAWRASGNSRQAEIARTRAHIVSEAWKVDNVSTDTPNTAK